MTIKPFGYSVAAITASLLFTQTAGAQDLPNLVSVAVVQVNIGMTAEFEAAQRDMAAHLKETASKQPRIIYNTVVGNTGEYRIVTPMENFAALGSAEPQDAWTASWIARITKSIRSRETLVAEVMKDLSNPWEGQPPMGMTITLTIAEGKSDQFDEFVKSQWTPLRKKLGLRGPIVYRSRFGDRSRRLRVFVVPMDDWASIDGPDQLVAKGGEAARAVRDKLVENISDSVWIVTQFRSDLSYMPSAD